MKNKPFPVLCRECRFSIPEGNSNWNLRCVHPVVNAKDSWALSRGIDCYGSATQIERDKKWFAACGIKGKLWEPK